MDHMMDELDEAVPHSNSNWPDISQMARQIKNLKPLYEVKLLILLTGENFLNQNSNVYLC